MPTSLDTGTLNFCWSQALIGGLVAAGVECAVISPGSRSTPLALAMLRQPGLDCEVIIDERSAAFFALGAARASRRPVIVLATSGTAVANWLPAVIEANLAGVPLILISADRPPELQGIGANQTMAQPGLFSEQVRACHALGTPEQGFDSKMLGALAARAVEQASWPHPGPVHINQPFREPLIPANATPPAPTANAVRTSRAGAQPDPAAIAELANAMTGRPGLIVCGELPPEHGFAEAVCALAEYLACPILAEPLSNLRFGQHDRSHLIVHYNQWLNQQAAALGKPAWILRFGAFPVTRSLQGLLGEHSAMMALADPWPRWNDPTHRLSHLLHASPLAVCQALLAAVPGATPTGWLASWLAADQGHEASQASAYARLIPHLMAALPAYCPVFVGNSLAIRMLDSHSGSSDKPLEFFANRGASGIDGNISSALGIAAERGRVVALLGDLTCQHDIGGLAAARGRNAVILAVNNGGGGIFEMLPQAALPEFERGWLTPQNIDFHHAARAFGLSYAQSTVGPALAELVQAAIASGGPHLIEVTLEK